MTSTTDRARETREAIMDAAERLFAEHGVGEVSNRQICEAAGQANNFAVGYHFGSKDGLIRAIIRRHAEPMEQRRPQLLAQIGDSAGLRDWISCLVRPATDHLEALGVPSWRARCIAQIDGVPAMREIVLAEITGTPSMRRTLEGMSRLLTDLPAEVHRERGDMTRLLIAHTLAERERALHEGGSTARTSWEATAIGLIDALVGLWLAPVTPVTPVTGTEP